jgi:hypothetical protein
MPSGMLLKSTNSPSGSRRTPVANGVVYFGGGTDFCSSDNINPEMKKKKQTLNRDRSARGTRGVQSFPTLIIAKIYQYSLIAPCECRMKPVRRSLNPNPYKSRDQVCPHLITDFCRLITDFCRLNPRAFNVEESSKIVL